jgi:hypothetical protein
MGAMIMQLIYALLKLFEILWSRSTLKAADISVVRIKSPMMQKELELNEREIRSLLENEVDSAAFDKLLDLLHVVEIRGRDKAAEVVA